MNSEYVRPVRLVNGLLLNSCTLATSAQGLLFMQAAVMVAAQRLSAPRLQRGGSMGASLGTCQVISRRRRRSCLLC